MSEVESTAIVSRIKMAHSWILQATERLTEDELCHRFGPTAPPIGWHLWHIARWADRVQASLPRPDVEPNTPADPNWGIWEQEKIANLWDLDPATLGTLQEGSGMDFDVASELPRHIGRDALLGYARRVFAVTDEALDKLLPAQLQATRESVMQYSYTVEDGKIERAPGKETTLAADLLFHVSHTNRHLGMMEALGGLLERKGTVTV
jgi:hypothetical protein